MPTKIVYSAAATATGGRDGHSKTHDGALDVDLAVPTEMGGPGGGINPEQLFATGYAACFLGAVRHYAKSQNAQVPDDTEVTVTVGIGPREDDGFGIDVKIKVNMPGVERSLAEDLIAGGHKVCPYSHALTGTMQITPELA
ncbi:organic hydroperoxide resistance protein [Pseudohoeflea coraliihabitans]|uniref:Organic hydroperoxide resistance protein n=1 Tax=Pseudohoeflea coraliihabitans TaxID=2860393 RepID=A0ABS6WRZ3_9HYPH|nr:organic hydroperoxide resistance protein [Pseudohoeflea sp. DP4N28-3]MBW3098739.1 organic hydroperoxide resistance protein [Pseudohoeflea sp. DP4N28-3]